MSENDFAELYWARLKTDFDPYSDVDASPVRYATAIINLADFLLEKFDAYEAKHFAIISEIENLNLPKEFKITPGDYISKSHAEIKKLQYQAKVLRDELQTADDLEKLAALETKPRPTFALVAEILVEKVQLVLTKTPQDIQLYETHSAFLKDASKFVYQPLYSFSNYGTPRYYTSLLELWRYVREGNLLARRGENSTVSNLVLRQLIYFRTKLDKLYEETNGFNSDIDERDFATAPLIANFRASINEIASTLENSDERRWLNNWANTLK